MQVAILYKECLVAWSGFNNHTPLTTHDVLNEIIIL